MVKYLMLLLLPTLAQADSYFKYGIGFDHEGFSPLTKSFSIGVVDNFASVIDQQWEVGVLTDSRYENYWTFDASYSLGITIDERPVYARSFWGVALINRPDENYLTSLAQFKYDLEIGFSSRLGNKIGVCYQHLSNAGIWGNNWGRNYILLKMSIPY